MAPSVYVYRLRRDDGVEFRCRMSLWEGILELAYRHGWSPVGTQEPHTDDWRSRRSPSEGRTWDRHDYFSHELQHVGRDDARSLSGSVLRALSDVKIGVNRGPELSASNRKAMQLFAAFAGRGGFTIGSAP